MVPAFIFRVIGAPLINWSVKKWKQLLNHEKEEQNQLDTGTKTQDVGKIPLESLFHDRVLLNVELRNKEDAIKMLCSELMKMVILLIYKLQFLCNGKRKIKFNWNR